MTEQEYNVTAMLDREAIRDLVTCYCDAIWRGDIVTVVDLFTKDGSVQVLNGPMTAKEATGHDKLYAFYITGMKEMTPRPFPHGHWVELRGNYHAAGRVYVELRSSIDFSWVGAVVYSDDYVKIDGRWRIQRREVHIASMS